MSKPRPGIEPVISQSISPMLNRWRHHGSLRNGVYRPTHYYYVMSKLAEINFILYYNNYCICQVNGVKLSDILFRFCVSGSVSVRTHSSLR